jgi:RNA polymerase sigma-70 factor, ECF subfamily
MRDPALERAFAERQSWAYEAAYRRFGTRMYAAALRILRDRGGAQDCVHEVMLHLWRRGDAYQDARGSLEAFLVTCSRNSALGRLRRSERHDEIERRAGLEVVTEDELIEDPIERDRVARAVAALTPAQAKTIELAYYGGFTHAEIARDLGEPIGTVKSRIAAALRALRHSLVEASDG